MMLAFNASLIINDGKKNLSHSIAKLIHKTRGEEGALRTKLSHDFSVMSFLCKRNGDVKLRPT